MVYSFISETGRIRANNEDFIALPEKGLVSGLDSFNTEKLGWLFVLCDGMGGANAGEVASSMAAGILLKEYYSIEKKPDDPGFFISEKILEINSRILRRALKVPEFYGMGTTLVSLLLDGKTAYINSVGDSRVYLMRRGVLEQITEDQSLVWEYYKSGKMTKEDIRKHPRNNIITCALGTDPEMLLSSVESYKINAREGDAFLLCSDGLSDMLSDSGIEKIMNDHAGAAETAAALAGEADRAGGKDNISLVLVKA